MSGIILNIQNRNKISGFQKGVFYKVLCLQRAVFIRAVIVISATNQQTGFGIFPVIFKLHINTVYSHGRTDKHKDRKSTRLNSSHVRISYAVFCLKKKKKQTIDFLQSNTIVPR